MMPCSLFCRGEIAQGTQEQVQLMLCWMIQCQGQVIQHGLAQKDSGTPGSHVVVKRRPQHTENQTWALHMSNLLT